MPGVWYSPLQTGLESYLLSSVLFSASVEGKRKKKQMLVYYYRHFFLGIQVTVKSILHALFVIEPGLKELLAPKSRLQT